MLLMLLELASDKEEPPIAFVFGAAELADPAPMLFERKFLRGGLRWLAGAVTSAEEAAAASPAATSASSVLVDRCDEAAATAAAAEAAVRRIIVSVLVYRRRIVIVLPVCSAYRRPRKVDGISHFCRALDSLETATQTKPTPSDLPSDTLSFLPVLLSFGNAQSAVVLLSSSLVGEKLCKGMLTQGRGPGRARPKICHRNGKKYQQNLER
jgi:hypothetical protein